MVASIMPVALATELESEQRPQRCLDWEAYMNARLLVVGLRLRNVDAGHRSVAHREWAHLILGVILLLGSRVHDARQSGWERIGVRQRW